MCSEGCSSVFFSYYKLVCFLDFYSSVFSFPKSSCSIKDDCAGGGSMK